MLREAARVLADDLDKRVVVVDTSNEIAGDGDIPHPAIGKARRMQVRTPSLQHEVMIEAVENHMPQVIVIDEIGTELEAQAARTIAERGVQLIGTAHGNTLDNLMLNPTLSDLIGGIQSVTLGDEEARRRRTQKSVLERKAPPTFDVVIEIQDRERVLVHADVADTVDAMLRGDVQSRRSCAGATTRACTARSRGRGPRRASSSAPDRFSGLIGSGERLANRARLAWRFRVPWRFRLPWRLGRLRAGARQRSARLPSRRLRARGGPGRSPVELAAPRPLACAGSGAAGRGAVRRRRDRRPRAARAGDRAAARAARSRGARAVAPAGVARVRVEGDRHAQGGGGHGARQHGGAGREHGGGPGRRGCERPGRRRRRHR